MGRGYRKGRATEIFREKPAREGGRPDPDVATRSAEAEGAPSGGWHLMGRRVRSCVSSGAIRVALHAGHEDRGRFHWIARTPGVDMCDPTEPTVARRIMT